MAILLSIAWGLVPILKFGGVIIGIAGVAIFGFHFIRENARAARGRGNAIPRAAWRGNGPNLGIRVLAAGVLLQIAAFVIAIALPDRL